MRSQTVKHNVYFNVQNKLQLFNYFVYKGNVQRHHQRIAWEPSPDKSIIFALPAPKIVPIPPHMMTAVNKSSALVPENLNLLKTIIPLCRVFLSS